MRNRVLKLLIPAAGVPLAVVALLLFAQKQPTAPTDTTHHTTHATPTTRTVPYAVVGEFEGKLAVFRNNTESPSEVLDVYIASLPESEQTALKHGIATHSEIELQRLLEDYTG